MAENQIKADIEYLKQYKLLLITQKVKISNFYNHSLNILHSIKPRIDENRIKPQSWINTDIWGTTQEIFKNRTKSGNKGFYFIKSTPGKNIKLISCIDDDYRIYIDQKQKYQDYNMQITAINKELKNTQNKINSLYHNLKYISPQ